MYYPTPCINKISYLSNQSTYNPLLLHFIHFKCTEVLERAVLSSIMSERGVDYNQNYVFKRSLTCDVYRWCVGDWLRHWNPGFLLVEVHKRCFWLVEMVWRRPSCCNFLFPASFPAREYSASGLGLKCPEISDLRGSAGMFGPATLHTQSKALWNTGRKPLE